MSSKIFVNYRRDDSAAHALNVAQYLEREFGGANVFLDIDRMKAGQKFPVVLEERLSVSTVMIVVIGPYWLTLTNKNGERRIDDPEDWVRLEIARALERGVPVIPVLVGGASLPDKSELPDDLKSLVEHQIATITTNGFRNEMAGLARDIGDLQGGSGKLLPTIALAVCLAAAIGISIYARVISLPKSSPTTTLAVAPVASTSTASDPITQNSNEPDVGRADEVQRKAEEEKSRKAAEEQLKAAEAETRRKAEEAGYEIASELGTVEAWDAFLKRFPGGFRAEVAQATRDRLLTERKFAEAPAPKKSQPAPSPAVEAEPSEPPLGNSLWDHNGSVMMLEATGSGRRFYYRRPRSAMRQAGWRSGDLLFEGQTNGSDYWGTAWLNSRYCGKMSYEVSGRIDNGGERVVMNGQAPERDKSSCQVTGYHNDHLVFDFQYRQ